MLRVSCLILFFVSFACAKGNDRPAIPNIVIMMADDMGLGDTSAYLGVSLAEGSDSITRTLRTPNLERFAKESVLFTDAHAPASMCSSTRYSLLTGRYAHRSYLKQQGWLPHGPNAPMIQKALSTLPEMLQKNGYYTKGVGKYHVGVASDDGYGAIADEYDFHDVDFSKPLLDGPTHHGFDEFFGVTGNTEDPLDFEPRNYIINDHWRFQDRSAMKLIGMRNRAGRVLAAPDWDLKQLGPDYLAETKKYISERSQVSQPFFLYYVPNANHYQRWSGGDYAVPDELEGEPIAGTAKYTDGMRAGDREDMVIENDVAFGKMIRHLKETEDPRWPGHSLYENTLIIFTSDNGPNVGDNLGTNQESGGLRSKKAKIWEGGIRVPFLVFWKGKIDGGRICRDVFSLTDLYATLGGLINHRLQHHEAQDSLDCSNRWLNQSLPTAPDLRPRVFFCHLGPPFSNDVLAIRRGNDKLLVQGGLALNSIKGGKLGACIPNRFYDLQDDLYEQKDEISSNERERASELAAVLLKLHNQGYSRKIDLDGKYKGLVIEAGWHNLRNDLNGEIGYTFSVKKDLQVTHLGMWDDHRKDQSVRDSRSIPGLEDSDQPSLEGAKGVRGLDASHQIRLINFDDHSAIALVSLEKGQEGQLLGEFRYHPLSESVSLRPGKRYALLMETNARDGDYFHDPISFDGLSPLLHSNFTIENAILIRNGNLVIPLAIPSHTDLHDDSSRHRLPVGPTLLFEEMK